MSLQRLNTLNICSTYLTSSFVLFPDGNKFGSFSNIFVVIKSKKTNKKVIKVMQRQCQNIVVLYFRLKKLCKQDKLNFPPKILYTVWHFKSGLVGAELVLDFEILLISHLIKIIRIRILKNILLV